ncbi:OsmC family protein [Syntrophotalea carbinolica]|nr:OsmC family protein [Syntrophotalea carbinolica]
MKGKQTCINGVDIEQLRQNISNIEKDPSLAHCQFRATNRWQGGGHSQTVIHDFHGAGQEITHRHDFRMDADEPPLLLGEDIGANPVEYVLTALSACLTTSLIYLAAAQGITLREVESDLEGDLDIRGFLGLSEEVRNGYEHIRVNFRIKADAPQEKIEELIRLAVQRSPVFDVVSNPIPVSVKGEKVVETAH